MGDSVSACLLMFIENVYIHMHVCCTDFWLAVCVRC